MKTPYPRVVVAALVALGTVASGAFVADASTQPSARTSKGAQRTSLYDTWTGYPVGQFLEAVVAADLDGDGAPDLAWARAGSPDNQMMVQLNRGNGSFAPAVGYPAVGRSNDIQAADLDGDTHVDLVVISQGDSLANSTIDLYLNNGKGSFTHKTAQGGSGPLKLTLADFSGDGLPDIAMTNYWSASGDISVLINKGKGTFAAQVRYPIGDDPSGITSTDLDGDGDIDLAVAHLVEGGHLNVDVLTNNGKGAFVAAKVISIDGYIGTPVVASADMDGDGDQDLVASGQGAEKVWVLLNKGGLTFTQSPYAAGFTAFDLRLADLDRNGDIDVVSTDYSSNAGEMVILRNNGKGQLSAPESFESTRVPHDMAVADFDGDGRADIAVASRETDTGAIHLQRRDGTFAASAKVPPIYPTAFAPHSLTSADLDLDGDIDVIATLPDFFTNDDAVQVMLNDGKGRFSAGESIHSTYDFPQGIATGDFNDDGYADLVWTPDQPPYPYVYAINNGDGTFASPIVGQTATCGTGDASTADVDNDGDIDIIVPNNRGGPGCDAVATTARIVPNKGDGTFGTDYGVDFKLLQEYVLGADLNGDGKTDLMSAAAQNGVVLGKGGGAFGPVQLADVRGTNLQAGDLDDDGDLDVVSGDSSFSQTTVMRNDGRGRFRKNTIYPSEQVSTYANVWDVGLGDFDGDGRIDIAVSNTSANDVGLHFGRGDATFQRRQVRYGTHANPLDIAVADFNGDGRSDIVTCAAIGSSFVTPRGISPLLS